MPISQLEETAPELFFTWCFFNIHFSFHLSSDLPPSWPLLHTPLCVSGPSCAIPLTLPWPSFAPFSPLSSEISQFLGRSHWTSWSHVSLCHWPVTMTSSLVCPILLYIHYSVTTLSQDTTTPQALTQLLILPFWFVLSSYPAWPPLPGTSGFPVRLFTGPWLLATATHCPLHLHRPHHYTFMLSDFNYLEPNEPLLGDQTGHEEWSQGMW